MPRLFFVLVGLLLFVSACGSDGGAVDSSGSTVPEGSLPQIVEAPELAGRSVRGFLPDRDAERRIAVVVTFGASDRAEVWIQLAEGEIATTEWTVSGQTVVARLGDVTNVVMADACLTTMLPEVSECEPLPPFTVALRGEPTFDGINLTSDHTNSLPPPFAELDGWIDATEDELFD